ncbi:FAD/NAD(P)-binding domain-containing protein [Polyplosphaeria fusca]|uniref:FAD/NAD(P)-binding domain-containing protein n=1 Tax=Polyplosphaeria fusca TaxID=682080 RepID=A0A9P4QH86_9PLEO|nr:FAD/NAD(P)-binding domain-containing protein [Polyplosphaeria fusca]
MASVPVLKKDLDDLPGQAANRTTPSQVQHYDAIIIGAGFSGIANLHRLRQDGLKAHIYEGASDFGGVWYWNRYPGAKVDSESPFYQLNIPEVYNTFNFNVRFPDHKEIRRYMAHVDKVLNIRKDCSFDSRVNSATWDEESGQWTIKTDNGLVGRAKYLILASGLLHKTHTPDFPDIDKYKGMLRHSGDWPEDTSVKGKKVAVIGAGATSVQIVEELAKEADHLTMYLRRPSYCVPMRQRKWTVEEQDGFRAYYPALFAAGRNSAVGFPTTRADLRVQDVSPEEREVYWEEIWKGGGFQFLLRNYSNVMLDEEANRLVYDFWKKKVRERLTDPKKQELMAPDEMPYYFGTKRTPLEHDYYDVLNQKNVEIVDLKANPLHCFTEKGLQLGGEGQQAGEQAFDVIVCATGFDSFTGSLTHMGLKNKDGVDMAGVWKGGVRTYLGMTVSGFPNAFMVYTPQAPTALSNGTTILEAQMTWICDAIKALDAVGAKSIEATPEAEDEWAAGIDKVNSMTLYPHTNSWWNASNIPGKKTQNMTYLGGINNYEAQCRATMDGWKGFKVVCA